MNLTNKQLEAIFSNYENDKLLTNKDLIESGNMYDYDSLGELDMQGMLLSAFRVDGKLKIAFTRPAHTLIIGATESGKTTGYISPAIQILSQMKNKSSMFITDPKGELMSAHYNKLISQGYEVRIINLRNPNFSDYWNPLTDIYDKFQIANMRFKDYAKTVMEVVDESGVPSYVFDGKTYYSPDEVYEQIRLKQDEIKAECDNEISTFAETFMKKENLKEPYWDVAARELFLATLYAFLEDSIQPGTSVTRENFNLKNIIEFLSEKDLDGIRGIFSRFPKNSKAFMRSAGVRSNAETTASCILGGVNNKLSPYKNYAIMKIMSDTNIPMEELDSGKPVAMFLIIADEKDSNYDIAVLFTSKIYEKLVHLAEKNGGRLKRPFHFILDEFGNLPMFPNLSNMLTAGRSRGIWLTMVVQSYAQIDRAYDSKMREVLKDNCSQKIFFGTNDYETRKTFSQECGKKTIISPKSFLTSKGAEIEEIITEQVDLVTATELNLMQEGVCYNMRFRNPLLKAEIERSYLSAEYDMRPMDIKDVKKTTIVLSDKRYQFDGKFVSVDLTAPSKRFF